MELVIFFFTIVVFYLIIKWIVNSIKSLFSHSTSRSSYYVQRTPPKPTGRPGRWYGPGHQVSVGKYDISEGMVYVGGHFTRSVDGSTISSCLINPDLKIQPSSPDIARDEMGYWPRYSDISPTARGAYLSWLSSGRKDPNANIGLVFLFFYGIERRLFAGLDDEKPDSDEVEALADEVRRLLSIYGDNHSFSRYAHQLLNAVWLVFNRNEAMPADLDISEPNSEMVIQYLVATHSAEAKPIPANLALAWLHQHPDRRLRTAARRCQSEFAQLFKHLYTEKYHDGIVVKPNKRTLSLTYTVAGSTYGSAHLSFSSDKLPDPFLLTGPFNKLQAIADTAADQLDAYSRYLGKKGSDSTSMDAMALLPPALIKQEPKLIQIQQKLDALMSDATHYSLISVKDLYSLIGQTAPAKLAKKEASSLAEMMEKLGYGIAPDMRYHNAKLDPQGSAVLFHKGHGIDFRPSAEFGLLEAILRLGALVSQIDGVSPQEESLLQSVVQDNRNLNGIEKDSLAALLHWMLCTPQNTAGIKQKLSVVGQDEREAISHILIAVAHADGHIDPSEVKQLEKLYTTLGLDKGQVTSDLHVYAANNAQSGETGPVTIATKTPELSHSIPTPRPKHEGFQINEELLRLREQETHQVKSVLAEIFAEEDESLEAEPGTQNEVATASAFEDLDETHRILFEKLITKESWDRESLHKLCDSLKLFLDGAMETINEWSYEHANAPLIDDGEPVYVDIELAKELVEA